MMSSKRPTRQTATRSSRRKPTIERLDRRDLMAVDLLPLSNSFEQGLVAEGEDSFLMGVTFRTTTSQGLPLDPTAIPLNSTFNLVIDAQDLRTQPIGVFAFDTELTFSPQGSVDVAIGEIQAITFPQAYTSGTFTLSFEGQTTVPIAAPASLTNTSQLNATASAIRSALIPIVGSGNVEVHVDDDLAPAKFLVQFKGARVLDDVPALVGGFSQVTGAAVVDNHTPSNAARSDILRTIIRAGQGYTGAISTSTNTGSILVGSFFDNFFNPPNTSAPVPVIIVPMVSKANGSTVVSGIPNSSNGHENLLYGSDLALPPSAIRTTPLTLVVSNDSIENLGDIQGTVQRSGLSLTADESADWFRFTTLATGTVANQASIQFLQTEGDLELELYDSSEQLLERSATANSTETVSLRNLPPGTYSLKVTGFSGATNPNYSLTINAPVATIPSDRYESNDALASATDLGAIEGDAHIPELSIHNSSDIDFYQFELKATGRVGNSISTVFSNALGDLDLRLFNAAGNQIAASETSQDGESISLAGKTAGVYYIQVVGASGATNSNYQLMIDAPTFAIEPDHFEPNNSLATATPLAFTDGVANEQSLTIQSLDNDWFQFSIPSTPSTAHYASVDFSHLAGDLDVELYNAQGAKLRESKSTRDQERISLAGLPTGDYFLKVFGNGSATNPNYSLQVVIPTVSISSDQYEPNDTRVTATDLRTVSGIREVSNLSIHTSGNDDWFRFETTATANTSHFVGLVLDYSQGDVDLQLFDASGTLLATSATSNNWEIINLGSRPAGVYYVRIYGYQNGTSPRYFLSMQTPETQIAADRFEANETLATATSLRTIEGERTLDSLSIHTAGDIDWYSFETTTVASSLDYIALNFTNTLGNIDLNLYDASGNLLRQSNSSGDGERITLAGLSAGRYFARVAGLNANATSPQYSMTINAPRNALPLDRFEGNDSLAASFNLRSLQGFNSFTDASIHAAGNDDWFRFETLATGVAQHYVEASFSHSQGDLDIALYNNAGVELASSRSNANAERISLNTLPAGVYFLKVAGFAGATNPNYTLSFLTPVFGDLIPDRFEANNSLPTATQLRNDGTSVTGAMQLDDLSLHALTDVDHYQFTTNATGKLSNSVSVTFNRGNGELFLELLNSNGQVIRSSDSATGTEYISLSGLAAATYTIRVSGQDGARTPYQLAIDAPAPAATNQLDAWTIMVYMTSSDLAEFAFSDLNELEQIAASLQGSVNIAVLWDQSAQLQQYSSGNGSQSAWGSVGRGFIRPDLDPSQVATSFEVLGELNTGDAATLTNFIDWASIEAPAQKYALISWDHGAGIYGSNFDNADGTSGDNLRLSEIASAIQASRVPQFDLIAFDACLMAMAEVAYNLRTTTDVLVASQEVVGADGYNYQTALAGLVASPYQTDVEQFASSIVSSYAAEYSGSASGWDTQSAIRTSAIGALTTALNSFANAVSALNASQLETLATAFESAVSYADPDFRDIGSIMQVASTLSGLPGSIVTSAASVLQALDNSLVALAEDVRRSSGLSIFVPEGTSLGTFYQGEFSGFVAASGWSNVISRIGGASGQAGGGRFGRSVSIQDWAEDNNLPATAENLFRISGAGISFSDLSLHETTDVDWFRFTIGATGQSTNRISVVSTSTENIQLELYNATGTTMLRSSAGSSDRSVSLQDITAGEYTVKVFSPTNAAVRKYAITANAPVPAQTVSRLGDISVQEKAYPVGVVGNQISLPGLEVAAGKENWFAIDTPRLPSERWFSVTLAVPVGQTLSATIVDANGKVVSRDSGDSPLVLGYLATGGAEKYYLRVVNESGSPASFNVRINNLVETYADVAVHERLSAALVDQLPLTELVSTVSNVTVLDDRFEWVANGLRLRPGAFLKATEQSRVFVRVEVADAFNPGSPVSFVLPIKVIENEFPFHNSLTPRNVNNDFDTNGNPRITAIDALLVINALRARNFNGEFRNAGISDEQRFIDVTGDGELTARDAILVINQLRGRATGEGEFAFQDSTSIQAANSQSPIVSFITPMIETNNAESDKAIVTDSAISQLLGSTDEIVTPVANNASCSQIVDSYAGGNEQADMQDAEDDRLEQLLEELADDLYTASI